MYGLFASSVAVGAAITALLAAMLADAPSQERSSAWLYPAGAAMLLGAATGLATALGHRTQLSLVAWAVAVTGASWCIWSLRAEDSGGGEDGWRPGGGPDEPPDGPSGDWDRFERDFWDYVDARSLRA